MLHAGLDLSRKRLDFHLLDERDWPQRAVDLILNGLRGDIV